jgi:hypothetical protein
VARAQQPAVPVIGYLSAGRKMKTRILTAAFRQGLSEQGFIEGRMSRFCSGGQNYGTINCRYWPRISCVTGSP